MVEMNRSKNANVVLAIAAHPDDIEFMMGGTLSLLSEKGWDTHYLALANGYVGSASHQVEEIVFRRTQESKAAAKRLGATWHPPIVNDVEVEYSVDLVRRLTALIREIKPNILLTQAPDDYMEDHSLTSRAVSSAAFNRNMPNFQALPPAKAYFEDIVIYHSLPHGLYDPLRRLVYPGIYVDTTSVQDRKRAALSMHESQEEWLRITQGFASSLANQMDEIGEVVGKMSGRYEFAEGWRRHNHLGYASKPIDTLVEALGESCFVDSGYEENLRAHPAQNDVGRP